MRGADGDFAPHCPLVVGSFSTPCLASSPAQSISREEGPYLKRKRRERTMTGDASMLAELSPRPQNRHEDWDNLGHG